MTEKIKYLCDLRRMRDEIQAEIDGVQAEIAEAMTAAGVDTMTADSVKVTYKPVKSSRFDKAAYIRDHGEASYKSYCKTTESRRFTVSA